MAGILFTDGNLVLAGYKPYKGYVTGIGGKQKHDEPLFQCAVRETLEELFGLRSVGDEIIQLAVDHLRPTRETHYRGYTQFHCSFENLRTLLVFFSMFVPFKTPLYERFPFTVEELIFNRKIDGQSEIAQLVLLPFVPDLRIAHHFANDLTHALLPASMTSSTPHTDTSTQHSQHQS